MPISGISLGGVISVNGRLFSKINSRGEFMALQPVARTMQSFTTADCAAYPTPSGTNYTAIGKLMDSRDGKSYEIRKFADGKCWMADNLMYGGGTDGSSDYCAGKTTFRSANSAANASATTTNGLNPTDGSRTTLVGDCRDPRAGGTAPCTTGTTVCGYYYNWPAAVQSTSAYYGGSYQPSKPTQGICPTGWHVPSGATTGEYAKLDIANGGTGTDRSSCATAACNFWRPGNAFNGIYSGRCDNTGSLSNHGLYGIYWSSTQYSAIDVYRLAFDSSSYLYTGAGQYNLNKYYGLTVRCIKD